MPRLLAASLGDVYVILATHLDRAAIRDQILRDHTWLKDRCDTTVVVAHSAGSALTHQLIRDDRMTGVTTYITLGEAIWRMRWMAKLSAKGAWRMLGIGLAVTGTALIAGGWAVLALELAGSSERWGALALALGVVLHAVSAYVVWMGSDTKAERLEAIDVLGNKGITWRDYVASSDPVPAGALTERAHATRPAGRRARTADQSHYTPVGVRNRRSILRDHTSYAGNLEGFVAGLGIDLVNADVLPVPDVNGKPRPRLSLLIDEPKLKPWREARAERTLSRALMRFCSALVGLVVLVALTTADGALASVGGEDGWLRDALDWLSDALETVLPEDWVTRDSLGFAIALALLVASWLAAGLACRIWDGADRRRFLTFAKPSKDPSTDQDRSMAALQHPWPHLAAAVWWALVSAAAAFGLLRMASVDDTLWRLAAAASLALGLLALALVRVVKKARDLVYSSPADEAPAIAEPPVVSPVS